MELKLLGEAMGSLVRLCIRQPDAEETDGQEPARTAGSNGPGVDAAARAAAAAVARAAVSRLEQEGATDVVKLQQKLFFLLDASIALRGEIPESDELARAVVRSLKGRSVFQRLSLPSLVGFVFCFSRMDEGMVEDAIIEGQWPAAPAAGVSFAFGS